MEPKYDCCMSAFSVYFIIHSQSVADAEKVTKHSFYDSALFIGLTNSIHVHELNE